MAAQLRDELKKLKNQTQLTLENCFPTLSISGYAMSKTQATLRNSLVPCCVLTRLIRITGQHARKGETLFLTELSPHASASVFLAKNGSI